MRLAGRIAFDVDGVGDIINAEQRYFSGQEYHLHLVEVFVLGDFCPSGFISDS